MGSYDYGDTWNIDVCTECSCEMGRGMVCSRKICDVITDCDGELVEVEGECCPRCVPREPEPECRRAERNLTLEIDDCVSVHEVLATSCSGTCGSNATALFEDPYMESTCTCCKPSVTRTKVVDMICGDGSRHSHEYIEIESCECEQCEDHNIWPSTTPSFAPAV